MSKNRLLFVSSAIAVALAAGGCVSKGDYEKLTTVVKTAGMALQ